MDIAYEIAQYLATAGFGVLGSTIHVSQIPSDQDGIYVAITGGTLNLYDPIEDAVLDIYVKNTNANNAVTTLNQIKKHIHRMHTTVTTNSYIYSILALGNVETVDRNLEYAKLFKQTYVVKYRYQGIAS